MSYVNDIDYFKKTYYKKVVNFAKKNIKGKDFTTILKEQSKNVVVELMKTLLKLMVIVDSMKIVRTDSIDSETKKEFDLTVQCIDSICAELENMLVTIFE